jgi:GTP-binding protein Era
VKSGFVSLVGRPNAGKSSLLNRIVGVKLAIVSDKPQTTRTRILGVKNYPDGQVVFVDTPGVHRPLHRMNVRMMDAAVDSIRDVDVVGVVVDVSESQGAGTKYLVDLVRDAGAVVLILNKIDLMKKTRLLPILDEWSRKHAWAEIVPVSAKTGDNVDRLEQVLLGHLSEGEPLYPTDYLTDQPERVLVAEMVREQVLRYTRDELPFSTAVLVDRFEDDRNNDDRNNDDRSKDGRKGAETGLLRVYCSILVERESQKPIVIGKGGELIKRIGTAAREEIERFFGVRLFLDLRVTVKEQWRDDDRLLDRLGVRQPDK